jgi:hypothetical protein
VVLPRAVLVVGIEDAISVDGGHGGHGNFGDNSVAVFGGAGLVKHSSYLRPGARAMRSVITLSVPARLGLGSKGSIPRVRSTRRQHHEGQKRQAYQRTG